MRGWQKPLAGSDPSLLEPRVSNLEAENTTTTSSLAESTNLTITEVANNLQMLQTIQATGVKLND